MISEVKGKKIKALDRKLKVNDEKDMRNDKKLDVL
jgi:hypothetical protein